MMMGSRKKLVSDARFVDLRWANLSVRFGCVRWVLLVDISHFTVRLSVMGRLVFTEAWKGKCGWIRGRR